MENLTLAGRYHNGFVVAAIETGAIKMMGRAIRMAVLAGVIAGVTGCVNPTDKEMKSLEQGFSCYNRKEYSQAWSAASTYIEKYPGDKFVDEAYYLRGISRICCNDRAGAEKDLKEAISKTDRPDLKSKSNRALGDMAYENRQWEQAATYYRAAIAAAAGPDPKKPEGVADAIVFERLGNSLQAMGKWSEAETAYAGALKVEKDPEAVTRIKARQMARSYVLQFGMFANLAGAQSLIGTLRGVGVETIPVNVMRDGKYVWYVRSGKYVTLAEAESARSKMIAKNLSPIVVPQ
jgi:tetratricopeptide (TPR) repeat protein